MLIFISPVSLPATVENVASLWFDYPNYWLQYEDYRRLFDPFLIAILWMLEKIFTDKFVKKLLGGRQDIGIQRFELYAENSDYFLKCIQAHSDATY